MNPARQTIGGLLVTGAGGMLGQDVVRAGSRRGHGVCGLTRAELDVCDPGAVAAAVGRLQPDVVVNCAAWTDVDAAETAEDRALAVNGHAAGVLARECAAVGARLVHVSTDYVFDGRADRPYLESDAVGPCSAYGRTKLAGELDVLAAGGGHAVVRSSWLFGSGGRNFAATMLRLAGDGRDTVSVVTDQVGCPTFTGHLGDALVELAERLAGDGDSAGIHHVAGSGRCSWNAFAAEIFAQAGVDCRVLPATSAEMARPAPRPAWSVLGTERPDAVVLPAWEDGLAAYLAEIANTADRVAR
ncbi:MAG TPA: dTDP-4-dehydrorhamnose reductase [Solirubrobacteraceae bacterium]